MSAFQRTLLRLTALARGRALDRDLDEEMASHLAHAEAEYVARGHERGEARRLARAAFGGLGSAREAHREARTFPTVDSVRQDLIYAVRGFVRDPGFTAVAALILALGIGANTAVFSVVNPLMLRPLPFRDAHELAWIANNNGEGLSARTYRVAVYEELQRHTRSFQEMSAYFAFFGYMNYKLTGGGNAEALIGVPVTTRFFEVLGVQPARGRLFSPEEMRLNGPRAAILTHGLFQQRFASDPSLVGQHITINDEPVRVVGVLPADFDFGSVFTPGVDIDLFFPVDPDVFRKSGNVFSVVGRLKPDVTVDQARAELDHLIPQLLRQHQDWGRVTARVTSLKDYVSGRLERSLIVLWCAVGLVLLIVCANLSNLLLARTSSRMKEMAVRMALGAGRARVIRQLLTEGVLLALLGAAIGVPLAYALTWYLTSRAGLSLPLLHRVEVDGAALAFTALTAIGAGLAFGAIPALRIARRDPQAGLRDQARGSTDGPLQRAVRSSLVVAELALACVLLVGAGLLLRSFVQLLDLDLGFSPSRIVAVRVDPRGTGETPQQLARLEEIVRRARRVPGVEAAATTDALPLDRNRTWGVSVPGVVYPKDQRPSGFLYITGPGYFDAMGIAIKSGATLPSRTRPRPGR